MLPADWLFICLIPQISSNWIIYGWPQIDMPGKPGCQTSSSNSHLQAAFTTQFSEFSLSSLQRQSTFGYPNTQSSIFGPAEYDRLHNLLSFTSEVICIGTCCSSASRCLPGPTPNKGPPLTPQTLISPDQSSVSPSAGSQGGTNSSNNCTSERRFLTCFRSHNTNPGTRYHHIPRPRH